MNNSAHEQQKRFTKRLSVMWWLCVGMGCASALMWPTPGVAAEHQVGQHAVSAVHIRLPDQSVRVEWSRDGEHWEPHNTVSLLDPLYRLVPGEQLNRELWLRTVGEAEIRVCVELLGIRIPETLSESFAFVLENARESESAGAVESYGSQLLPKESGKSVSLGEVTVPARGSVGMLLQLNVNANLQLGARGEQAEFAVVAQLGTGETPSETPEDGVRTSTDAVRSSAGIGHVLRSDTQVWGSLTEADQVSGWNTTGAVGGENSDRVSAGIYQLERSGHGGTDALISVVALVICVGAAIAVGGHSLAQGTATPGAETAAGPALSAVAQYRTDETRGWLP